MGRSGPLDGLVVVAIEQAVAAPFCTSRLADAGARVMKIERPEGDFARGYDTAVRGQSSYFVWLNRGKESLACDLRLEDDRKRLRSLIAGADVLVQNLRPGALARRGLDLDQLRRDHPRLITCSISGYGTTGPMALRKAYDLLIQADAGLCAITGGPEAPSRVGISLVDIATGATAHAAILEALIARGIDGQGCGIDVSMFDVIADWMSVPLLQAEGGQPPRRMGMSHPSIAPYGAFATADGTLVLIAIQSEREWQTFCTDVIAQPDLPADPRFASNVARVRNRDQTDSIVASAMASRTAAEIESALKGAGIAHARVNDMQGLSRHPQLRRVTVETPEGPVAIPAPAPRFTTRRTTLLPVPAIGSGKGW